PVQRIEQVVQPTAQQQSAFNDLKNATQKASDQLQSSCPTAVPKSPVAQLDTVETQLTAVADAIKPVRPDLQNYYAPLTDEQKAKFNTMGPPPKATSSPQQRQSGGQQESNALCIESLVLPLPLDLLGFRIYSKLWVVPVCCGARRCFVPSVRGTLDSV